jgi:hypothetical protein
MEFDVWQYIWLTVHFGVPFFLMLLICIWAMSHFRWRVSRVKLWALSQAERARFGLSHWLPDLHGYEDRLKEWHQVAKTARGSNATSATCTGADEPMRNFALEYFARYRIPYVGLAVWMLVIAGPLLNLATWSALLIWRIRPVRIGVATAFIAVAFICLGFAIMNWRANSWQLNPIIRGAFYFGTACYFGATLVVVFNSADTSFFTLSVIFLTANFICVLELLAQSAATYLVDAEEFLGQQYCRDLVDGALSEFRRLNRGGADEYA